MGPEDINPYVEPEEQARLRDILSKARNEGLFTPQTLGRNQISIPGELGGSNWGGSAADPATGVLYVRSADQPGFHTLRAPGAGGGQGVARGRGIYSQNCEICHGAAEGGNIRSFDKETLISIRTLGQQRVTRTIREGQGQMPAFPEDKLSAQDFAALVLYILNPAAAAGQGGGGGRGGPRPDLPPMPEGLVRYTGPLGSMFRTSNGLSAKR
jgi:quinoprotein glucose dehydrogenase